MVKAVKLYSECDFCYVSTVSYHIYKLSDCNLVACDLTSAFWLQMQLQNEHPIT